MSRKSPASQALVWSLWTDGCSTNFTIAENVALPLRYHRNLPIEEMADTVETLLELLEINDYADLTPANVAASWRQRVALARALVLKPELLLLDNPLTPGLGTRHRQWLLNFLDQLNRGHKFFGDQPMTIVATTDDLRALLHPRRRKFATRCTRDFSPCWKRTGAARNSPGAKP